MMNNFLKLASLSLLTLALPTSAFAGAWTAKQDENYLKGAVNYFETSSRFGPEGDFENFQNTNFNVYCCLLYTSPSPRDKRQSRMPSSA